SKRLCSAERANDVRSTEAVDEFVSASAGSAISAGVRATVAAPDGGALTGAVFCGWTAERARPIGATPNRGRCAGAAATGLAAACGGRNIAAWRARAAG